MVIMQKKKQKKILLGMSLSTLLLLTGIYFGTEAKKADTSIPFSQEEIEAVTTADADVEMIEEKEIPLIENPDILTGTTDKKSDDEISIVMVGDVLLHTPINEGALQEDGSYSYFHLFSKVKDEIEKADIAIVNQEVIIGGKELGISGYPCFNAPYEVADALVDAGFDVILHATNHALDKGEKGIRNCLKNWREKYPDIEIAGIHDTEESANTITYLERENASIAILNYTYGTNGISAPAGKEYLVDYLEKNKVIEDIRTAKSNADFVIVCPHWGKEYSHEVSENQKKWTQLFWDEGVDLVMGTHPHVIQPIEMREDETKKMLVYYSLGNYINCTSGSGVGTCDRMIGGMASVTLQSEENTKKLTIKNYSVEPTITHMAYGRNEITTYFLKDYTPELALTNAIKNKDSSFQYQYCLDLTERVFGANLNHES